MDWNPTAMVRDLPWAVAHNHGFVTHLRAIRSLVNAAIVLYLQAPAMTVVQPAAEERGEPWLAESDRLAQAAGHTNGNRLGRIASLIERHIVHTNAELSAAADAGWLIEPIDATATIDTVLEQATTVIANNLTNSPIARLPGDTRTPVRYTEQP